MVRSRYTKRSKTLSSYLSVAMGVGFVCLVASLLLAVALLSFNPLDPSWFYFSSESTDIHNSLGLVGAHAAAFCFYFFGTVAYLLVPFLLYVSLYAFKYNNNSQEWDRLAATVVSLFFLTGIFHAHHTGSKPYMIAGGWVGQWLYNLFVPTFEPIGTIVFFYAVLFASFLVITRMTFITVLRSIKQVTGYLFEHRNVWLIPLVKGARMLVTGIVSPIVWFAKQAWATVRGSDVHEASESVFAFEQGAVDQTEETDSAFWNEYIQRRVHSDVTGAPKDVPMGSLDASEEGRIAKKMPGTVQPTKTTTRKSYAAPSPALFNPSDKDMHSPNTDANKQLASALEDKLERFGVYGTVVKIKPGPVITLFEYQPDIDAKVSKILSLEHDLAMALEAISVRIIAPIPGTNKVGFEVANKERKSVRMGDIIRSLAFQRSKAQLPLVLGQDTAGENVVVDLVDMPHLLVAGSTGSGKSVALNAMLASLLCKLTPDELKLIIIDPKRLEFAAMHDIAHLLFPVITEARRAAPVVRWLVRVMEERYEMMAARGVRSISDYKKMCKQTGEQDELPFIVLIIDELADLMMVAGKDIEDSIARLAQMARAAGIHLIIATQRPSVDVLTGVIKVNFASRVSFRVTSKVDSRTILDTGGAENLLGKGDMLFMDAQSARIRRIHGAYVSDAEVHAMANHIRAQQKVEYTDLQEAISAYKTENEVADEPLLPEVLEFLKGIDEISISSLQRRFKIGYNRSARLIELLEAQGKIMPASGSKMRKVIH